MLITTGYNFEGYTITDYLDIISEPIVIGTGFASSMSAALADFTGNKSNMYAEKMQRAKNIALNNLKKQADKLGGNGIIGIDIDYTTFANDVMGVIVSGTVVKLRTKKNSDSYTYTLPSMIYNTDLPFNICDLILTRNLFTKSTVGSLSIINYTNDSSVTAIVADIELEGIFGDIQQLHDIVFISHTHKNGELAETESTELALTNVQLNLIKSTYVHVKKFIMSDNDKIIFSKDTNTNKISLTLTELKNLRNIHGLDAVSNCCSVNENKWICYCGAINSNNNNACYRCGRELNSVKQKIIASNSIQELNYTELLETLETLENANQIYQYLISLNRPELEVVANEVQKLIKLERIYGCMKQSAVSKVKNLLN